MRQGRRGRSRSRAPVQHPDCPVLPHGLVCDLVRGTSLGTYAAGATPIPIAAAANEIHATMPDEALPPPRRSIRKRASHSLGGYRARGTCRTLAARDLCCRRPNLVRRGVPPSWRCGRSALRCACANPGLVPGLALAAATSRGDDLCDATQAGRRGDLATLERYREARLRGSADAAKANLQHTMAVTHDVFICHASEDKADLVNPLVAALEERGLRVWLDRMEILIGDSLSQKIDDGLANSRFGAVVISPAVLRKETHWVRRELDALAAREAREGTVVVLPVWHDVSEADVAKYSPLLAGKLAARTSDGVVDVANMIAQRCTHSRAVQQAEAATAAAIEPHEGASELTHQATTPFDELQREIAIHQQTVATAAWTVMANYRQAVTRETTLALLNTAENLAGLSVLGLMLLAGDVLVELRWTANTLYLSADPGVDLDIVDVDWEPGESAIDFAVRVKRALQRTAPAGAAAWEEATLFTVIERACRVGMMARVRVVPAGALLPNPSLGPILLAVNDYWGVTEVGIEYLGGPRYVVDWKQLGELGTDREIEIDEKVVDAASFPEALRIARRLRDRVLELGVAHRRW